MQVYEIFTKVYLKENISADEAQLAVCKLIDSSLAKDEKMLKFHELNDYKLYNFDSLYPVDKSKIYCKDKIYSFRIRTISRELAKYFQMNLTSTATKDMIALKSETKNIKKKHITKLYSLSPVVITTDDGYWKGNMSFTDYESRLKINLIKKYRKYTKEDVNEDFDFYTSISVLNKKPIAVKVKDVHYLGDKLSLDIADDAESQKIAYMALGTGIGEKGSRGNGFVNFKSI